MMVKSVTPVIITANTGNVASVSGAILSTNSFILHSKQ